MADINLDAAREARAARAEAEAERHTVTFAGRQFELPAKLSLRAMAAALDGDPIGLMRSLLGDDGLDHFLAQDADQDDLNELAKGLLELYGVGLGESLGSAGSSSSDSESSRPTSNGITASS